jgi:hypothetical protein
MWNDSAGYAAAFTDKTNTLLNYSFNDVPFGYTEKGFYFLGVIIKTISDNVTIYFITLSILTFLFLYVFARKYCMYPLIGLCVYMGRFLVGRNMVQIRAALAIAIIICGTKYITKQKLWKFLALVVIAYLFHHSAIIAIPVYFMGKLNIRKIHIFIGIIIAFIIAGFYGGLIRDVISNSEYVNEMASSYVQEGSEKAWSNTLANPMIYYQCFILFLFTFYERKFAKVTVHYYTIRNAYFYSTVILIVLCQYAVVAARSSTIFATYEMVVVPMFITLFAKKNRVIPYLCIMAIYAIFFFMNYKPTMAVLINQ